MPIYWYWIRIGKDVWQRVSKDVYDAFEGEKEIAPSALESFWIGCL